MAFLTDTHVPLPRSDGFWATFARGFEAYCDRRSRRLQIEVLQSKSDAELAAMGIPRDRIAHYVFRDLLGF